MRPKDLVPEQDDKRQPDIPDTAMWGLLLHCLDCYETYQDLRGVEVKVVNAVSEWLDGTSALLTDKEKEWCKGIAEQDAEEHKDNKHIRKWSYKYAAVTVVLRKLLVKKWKDPRFDQQLQKKRQSFESFIRTAYSAETDWSITNIAHNTRYGALEKTLSFLEKPETSETNN